MTHDEHSGHDDPTSHEKSTGHDGPTSPEWPKSREESTNHEEPTSDERPTPIAPEPGTVSLVGAGPGDPELLTLKAARLLESADVVCYDSLVGEEIVTELPGDGAEVVHVGKRPDGGRRWRQAEINRLLVREARAGNDVVRLKGGDPTVFGRGGEEAEYLADRGVPVEIVPGVTSPIAAPTSAGIPVTHREHASSLTVVTGHEDPTKDESALDWASIAGNVAAGGTLVLLMSVSRLSENVAALCEHGVDPDTLVAVVERATLPDSEVTEGTLATIVDRAKAAGVEPPATVVVGDVVGVRDAIGPALDAAADGAVSAHFGRDANAIRRHADGASTAEPLPHGPVILTKSADSLDP